MKSLRWMLLVSTLMLAVCNALGHQILLVNRGWSFDPVQTTGVDLLTEYFGSVAPDDGKAIRLSYRAKWNHWFYQPDSLIATAQQSGKALFTLQWIPGSKTDVPGNTEYSLLVEVQRALGSSSSGNIFPPGFASATTTVQSWLGSKQTYWPEGPVSLGLPWDTWPDDPSEYREMASSAFPCPVTFVQQGRNYFGVAELPSSYAATFTGTVAQGVGPIVDYATVVIRGKALECAGVTVELP